LNIVIQKIDNLCLISLSNINTANTQNTQNMENNRQSATGLPQVIYKSMISSDLHDDILTYYRAKESTLEYVKGSSAFPLRRQIREIPDVLAQELSSQLKITMSNYYTMFEPNKKNIRIYQSNYGIILPHRDIPSYPGDTHTCLIYLTDKFVGGVLSVKLPRKETHILEFGLPELRHLNITPEPRVMYGIIFPKDTIHYTDELLEGDKIILLIDCKVIY